LAIKAKAQMIVLRITDDVRGDQTFNVVLRIKDDVRGINLE